MAFSDSFFKKIENKTNVDKNTILSLAGKLQGSNMQDESTLREVIQDISRITGREVTPEKEQKIIDTVLNNNIPSANDIGKYLGEDNVGEQNRNILLFIFVFYNIFSMIICEVIFDISIFIKKFMGFSHS